MFLAKAFFSISLSHQRGKFYSFSGQETTSTERLNLCQAINRTLHEALDADGGAVCFGEDVAFGGVFRCTLGMQEKFGILNLHFFLGVLRKKKMNIEILSKKMGKLLIFSHFSWNILYSPLLSMFFFHFFAEYSLFHHFTFFYLFCGIFLFFDDFPLFFPLF